VNVDIGSQTTGLDGSLVLGGRIEGTVLSDVDASVLSNVTVQLYNPAAPASVLSTVYTASDGTYAFTGLAAGDYLVRYTHATHLAEWYDDAADAAGATVLTATLGGTLTADASLALGGRILGTLTQPDGTAGGAYFYAYVYDESGNQVGYNRSSWSDGTYEVKGLATGAYFVKFTGSNYSTEWYDDAVDMAGATPVAVTGGLDTIGIDHTMHQPALTIEDFTAPDFAALGGSVELSWTVRNTGTGPATSSWSDYIYISSAATYDGTATYRTSVSSYSNIPLAAGDAYTVTTTVSVPTSIGLGDRFFILRAAGNYSYLLQDTSSAVEVGAPDLIVDSVTAPGAASGGQSIDVSWVVKNDGADPAQASGWYDRVYLSTNSSWDTGDTQLWSNWTTDQQPLASGASYTHNHSITLPTTASGNQYLLFVTDFGGHQGETNENNNVYVHGIALNAPDLDVTDAHAPATGVLGETINVDWTVENIGVYDALANWYDRVYISDDTNWSPDTDTQAYSVYAGSHSPLAAGDSYTMTQSFRLPQTAPGNRYLLFVADGSEQQGETNENNNVMALPITLTAPDLTVTDVSAPTTALLSETVAIAWTVQNTGSETASAEWRDYVYLSQSTTLDGSEVFVDSYWVGNPHAPLAAGDSYTINRSITVPTSLALGSWNWIVVTDGTGRQGETDETNNAETAAVLIDAPNLEVTDSSAPTTAISGETISVSWTVTNTGGLPAPANWSDAVLLSPDGTVGNSVRLDSVGVDAQTPLAAGAHYDLALSVTLPSRAPGTYYLIFDVDHWNAQGESDETDNVAVQQIDITAPDLTVTTATAPTEASVNETIDVSWTGENIGFVAAPASWRDAVYLSTDNVLDGGDTRLDSFAMAAYQPLAAAGTYTHAEAVTLPAVAAGDYFLLFRTDDSGLQGETDETNNVFAAPITLIAPDLEVTNVSALLAAAPGQEITVEWTAENTGTGVASADWTDRIYISSSSTFDGTATWIANADISAHTPLAPGASYTHSATISLPSAVTGAAYLFVVADGTGIQGETDETNNAGSAAITVEIPDLTVSAVLAPDTAAVGQYIEVSWTVTNTDEGTAHADWQDRIYLSDDAVWDSGDTNLSYTWIDAQTPLASQTSYSLTRSVRLPTDAIGSKYLIVITDYYDYQVESDETNNAYAHAVTVSNPDLTVISADTPATASWGESVTLEWTVRNQGSGAAVAGWYDRVYVSDSATLDTATATRILSVHSGGNSPLASGAEYTVSRDVALPGGINGAAFIHIVTDDTGSQAEADETNNVHTESITFSAANLVITPTAYPATAAWGETVTVDWTVENQGGGPSTSNWWDMVYLSEDDTFNQNDDVQLASHYRNNSGGALTNDGIGYSVSRTNVGIPSSIPVGARYLFFVADIYGHQAETDTADNTVRVAINITAPDLRFDAAQTSVPSTGTSGNALAVSWTVENAPGAGDATRSWYDRVYLSTDPASTDGATLLKSEYRSASTLTGGDTYTVNTTVALPVGLTGSRYILIVTDGYYDYQPESDEANNLYSQAITLSSADLEVTNATATPNPVANGATLDVAYTVTNAGSATVERNWVERVWLSVDEFAGNSDDILVRELTETATLAASDSLNRNFSLTVPWGGERQL